MMQELILVFEASTLSALRTWKAIASVLNQHHLLPTELKIYDETVLAKRVTGFLEKRGKDNFLIEGCGFTIHQSTAARYAQSFVRIADSLGERIAWSEWCIALDKVGHLVMAWVVHSDYDFWQNAEDPLIYESRGRSYSNLPMRSNGLPPPLEQQVIDISKNPGRRIPRRGYVEAVGSRMWLTDRFWALTSASKSQMLKADWIAIREFDGVSELCVSSEPFHSDHGEDRVLQDRLRHLLFGR